MNDEQVTLMGFGLVALAILASGLMVSTRIGAALERKDLWKGSGVPDAAAAVGGTANAATGLINQVGGWIRV